MQKSLWKLEIIDLGYGAKDHNATYLNGKLVSELSMTPGELRKFMKLTRFQQLSTLAWLIDNLNSSAAQFQDWHDAS